MALRRGDGRGVLAGVAGCRGRLQPRPQSLAELEAISGGARSNLSRTLKSMERFGLVELVEGEGRTLQPRAPYDEIQLDLPTGRRRRVALSA